MRNQGLWELLSSVWREAIAATLRTIGKNLQNREGGSRKVWHPGSGTWLYENTVWKKTGQVRNDVTEMGGEGCGRRWWKVGKLCFHGKTWIWPLLPMIVELPNRSAMLTTVGVLWSWIPGEALRATGKPPSERSSPFPRERVLCLPCLSCVCYNPRTLLTLKKSCFHLQPLRGNQAFLRWDPEWNITVIYTP